MERFFELIDAATGKTQIVVLLVYRPALLLSVRLPGGLASPAIAFRRTRGSRHVSDRGTRRLVTLGTNHYEIRLAIYGT